MGPVIRVWEDGIMGWSKTECEDWKQEGADEFDRVSAQEEEGWRE